MTKTFNFPAKAIDEMSSAELLDYQKRIINKIYEIGIPLNENEALLLEYLSAQCDMVDDLLRIPI